MESDDPTTNAWIRFFGETVSSTEERAYRVILEEARAAESAVEVDWMDLHRVNENTAAFLLAHPYEAMAKASEATKHYLDAPVRVRIVNLPEDTHFGLSELRKDRLGQLVCVRGIVQSMAPVAALLAEAVFVCARCGNAVRVAQDEHLVLQEPLDCAEDQGGCGRQSKFKLVQGSHRGQSSVFHDVQVIYLQEPPENIRGTRAPERVPCFMEEDLCGRVVPSNRVLINGVLRSAVRKVGGKKTTMFDFFLDVVSVEPEKRDYDEYDPTPEELAEFHELAQSANLVEKLVGSIAPSIHGRQDVKQGLLLALFGGVPLGQPDGSRKRGNIHVLLVGDPGTAKSALGGAAVRLSPRGFYTDALSASVAGMIGGVEKVDKGLAGEGSVYQAGVVALAHRGMVYLDEVDKAKDENLLPALLIPLEQQIATMAKHGARGIVVPCEFSGVFGANPKNGRFDLDAPDLASQLNLPGPFMDRMDLLFILDDRPDEEKDTRLAAAVLRGYRVGTANLRRNRTGQAMTTAEARDAESVMPVIPEETLRKYISYAKREINPEFSRMVDSRIQAMYVSQRKKSRENPAVPVGFSVRTIEAIVRLTQAAARMRLSQVAEERDLDLAFAMHEVGWLRIATNSKGIIDPDRFGAAPSLDQREALKTLKTVMKRMLDAEPDGVGGDAVVAEGMRAHLSRDQAVGFVSRWKTDGTLMERGRGRWVLTDYVPRNVSVPVVESNEDPRGVRWSE